MINLQCLLPPGKCLRGVCTPFGMSSTATQAPAQKVGSWWFSVKPPALPDPQEKRPTRPASVPSRSPTVRSPSSSAPPCPPPPPPPPRAPPPASSTSPPAAPRALWSGEPPHRNGNPSPPSADFSEPQGPFPPKSGYKLQLIRLTD